MKIPYGKTTAPHFDAGLNLQYYKLRDNRKNLSIKVLNFSQKPKMKVHIHIVNLGGVGKLTICGSILQFLRKT